MRVHSIVQTCSACPSQWEAMTECGRKVYVRYRFGSLTVSVGEPGDLTEYAAVMGTEVVAVELRGGLDGVCEWSEVEPHIDAVDLSVEMGGVE